MGSGFLTRTLFVVATLWVCACAEPGHDLVRLPDDPPAALLIRNVALLDVESGERARQRDVLARGDRIAAIGVAGGLPALEGTEIIDGRGATLLPGLIDSHGHVSSSYAPIWLNELPDVDHNLQAYLYSGVTTVLDPADFGGDAVARRDRVAAGELLGPRIFTAGKPLTAPEGHPVAMLRELAPWWIRWYLAPRVAYQVDTDPAARESVAALSESGVDVVKVIVDQLPQSAPRLDNAALRAAVDEARKRNLRVVAHIGSLQDALDAGRAGVSAWVHGVYKEPLDGDSAALLAGFGIPMVPTTIVFENYALMTQYRRIATPLEREIAPAELLDAFNEPPDDQGLGEIFAPYLEMLNHQRQAWRTNVKLLRDAGVTILAGSDIQSGVFPGPGLHRELQLLHESGLSPVEVIRAATLDPARFLEQSDDPDFGQVKIGKRADLLLVNGDPASDLDAVSDIREVILGGVRLQRTPIEGTAKPGAG